MAQWLDARGWLEIEEVPLAVDLWAREPADRSRVIKDAAGSVEKMKVGVRLR